MSVIIRGKRYNFFDLFLYLFMVLFSFLCIFPFWHILVGSLNEGADYLRGGVYFWPRTWSLDSYLITFRDSRLLIGLRVAVARTVIGTLTSSVFTGLVAYGMSRHDLPLRGMFYGINIVTMFFGGGLIPFFLVLNQLRLINSFWVYIIPNLYSAFNMIIFMNFFKEIPEEIHESAVIDGASELRIFFRLYAPLSMPVFATVSLWVGVGHWNAFFDSMVYTTDANLQTLQLFLVKLIRESQMLSSADAVHVPAEVVKRITIVTVRYAAIVVSTLPILFTYPFLQKYLVKGILLGSLKG